MKKLNNKIIKCKAKDLKKELATAFDNSANSHQEKCSYKNTFSNYTPKESKSKEPQNTTRFQYNNQLLMQYRNKISEIIGKRAIKEQVLEGYYLKLVKTLDELEQSCLEQVFYENKINELEKGEKIIMNDVNTNNNKSKNYTYNKPQKKSNGWSIFPKNKKISKNGNRKVRGVPVENLFYSQENLYNMDNIYKNINY